VRIIPERRASVIAVWAKATLVLILVCIGVAQADPRPVRGTYRNAALGYSISVPRGLTGEAGDQAGPERGLGISLPSGGNISAFGEPNSLEWKSPESGVEWALANEKCSSGRQQETSLAHVGKLIGSKGKLVCNGRVLEILLVFRTGGGPIY
jgi:hypothetical protein